MVTASRNASACKRSLLLVAFIFVFASSALANSQYSGSWYNPDRNGEGFHVEILDDNNALVIWFTYPGSSDSSQARQAWILGTGTIENDTITVVGAYNARGPVFGQSYDKDDLAIETWGDLTVRFSDNNNGVVDYSGLDGSGSTKVIRLTALSDPASATKLPVGFSGAWYNPETNGQGWFIEVLSSAEALVYFFTYDENGNQAWNLDVGFIDGNKVVVPGSFAGTGTRFGNQFDKDDVELDPVVDVRLEFDSCMGGTAHYRSTDLSESATLSVTRLTGLADKSCRVLVVQPDGGGSIQSGSGNRDCLESRTCLVDMEAQGLGNETFSALPRSGYEFKGWHSDENGLCNPDEISCVPDLSGVENDAVLSPIFKPAGDWYYPPTNSIGVCSFVTPVDSMMVECEIKGFESYGYGPLTDFRVTSDDIFYDTKLRMQELQKLPEEQQNHMCVTWYGDKDHLDYSTYTPTPPPDPEMFSHAPDPGVWGPLKFGRVAYSLFDDLEAGKMILRSLLVWEEHQVDANWDLLDYGDSGEAHFQLGFLLPIYALAWDAIRDADFVTASDRQKIDSYLHKLMVFEATKQGRVFGIDVGDTYTCDDPCHWGNTEVFNHVWSQDLGLMTYGVMAKNDVLYQRGIARYFAILDGLVREDGSHYYESQRGGQALAYSIIATTLMIRMAELAANQGHDIYNAEVDGVSLHTIMEFHISALEDESIIYQYTQYRNDAYCGPNSEVDPGCSNWNNQAASENWPHGHRFNESWQNFELYRKRFPESPLVDRYLAMYPDGQHDSEDEGPLLQACEFRDVGD